MSKLTVCVIEFWDNYALKWEQNVGDAYRALHWQDRRKNISRSSSFPHLLAVILQQMKHPHWTQWPSSSFSMAISNSTQQPYCSALVSSGPGTMTLFDTSPSISVTKLPDSILAQNCMMTSSGGDTHVQTQSSQFVYSKKCEQTWLKKTNQLRIDQLWHWILNSIKY